MDTLHLAMKWATQNNPTSSLSHRFAFANSVAYLVTGSRGEFGGPSMREHLVAFLAHSLDSDCILPGKWSYADAVGYCAEVCFDPPQKYLASLRQVKAVFICLDDDPVDIEAVNGKVCLACGVRLATQAKGQYCKKHRGRSPDRRRKPTKE